MSGASKHTVLWLPLAIRKGNALKEKFTGACIGRLSHPDLECSHALHFHLEERSCQCCYSNYRPRWKWCDYIAVLHVPKSAQLLVHVNMITDNFDEVGKVEVAALQNLPNPLKHQVSLRTYIFGGGAIAP